MVATLGGSRLQPSSQALKKSLKTWKLKLLEIVEGRSVQVRNVPADFQKDLTTKIDRYMSATALPVSVKIRVYGYNCLLLWKLDFRDKMNATVLQWQTKYFTCGAENLNIFSGKFWNIFFSKSQQTHKNNFLELKFWLKLVPETKN